MFLWMHVLKLLGMTFVTWKLWKLFLLTQGGPWLFLGVLAELSLEHSSQVLGDARRDVHSPNAAWKGPDAIDAYS